MPSGEFENSQALALAAAANYERFFVPAIGRPAAEQLLAAAHLGPGERVLDVGCGTGIVARLAVEEVGPEGSVTGVDVNPAMLTVAGTAAPEGWAIEWQQAPAESIPLAGDAFDVVLCQMSLQFFQDRVQALREMRRVLAAGGRALLSLPGPMTPFFGVLEEALGRHLGPQAAAFVRQVFSLHEPDEIEGLLRQGGFRAIEIRSETLGLSLPGAAEFLEQYVASTPLSLLWADAEEPARLAVRREVLEQWRPLERDGGLQGAQPMVIAIAG